MIQYAVQMLYHATLRRTLPEEYTMPPVRSRKSANREDSPPADGNR